MMVDMVYDNMKIYPFRVIGYFGLHLGNIVGSTEHWCDLVLPSVLSRVCFMVVCACVCSPMHS